jgi:hypothetical protein
MATTMSRSTPRQWSPAPGGAADPIARSPEMAWEQAVLVELRAIRAALEQRQRPVTFLSRADRALLATMLPALVGVYGAETFTARDLTEDDRPAVRLVVGGRSVKKLAKLLARADGMAIDGLMLQWQGLEFQVTTWRIVAVGSGSV